MKALGAKYDNLENVSKFHQVSASVEAVRVTMEENIREALNNTASLENIQDQSDELREQSNIFRSSAKALKKKMWCQNMKVNKMTINPRFLVPHVSVSSCVHSLEYRFSASCCGL